ncbi:MAG: TonB-dependent receptor, partial [Flavobacteriaceae bacterium]|nr:TonB-dependent receptor [Flavobacteriaceae bacterium]
LLTTNQDLNGDKVFNETTANGFPLSVDFSQTKSELTGASNLLMNADVSYLKEYNGGKSIQGTLTFNYFSDRIFALGTEGKGNIIDSGIATLDFVFKSQLNKNLGIGITAKNLLNPLVKRTQETQEVIVGSYKLGTNIKLSLSYNF